MFFGAIVRAHSSVHTRIRFRQSIPFDSHCHDAWSVISSAVMQCWMVTTKCLRSLPFSAATLAHTYTRTLTQPPQADGSASQNNANTPWAGFTVRQCLSVYALLCGWFHVVATSWMCPRWQLALPKPSGRWCSAPGSGSWKSPKWMQQMCTWLMLAWGALRYMCR